MHHDKVFKDRTIGLTFYWTFVLLLSTYSTTCSPFIWFSGFSKESIKETLGFVTLDYKEELARAHPTVRSLADSCASPIIQVYPDGCMMVCGYVLYKHDGFLDVCGENLRENKSMLLLRMNLWLALPQKCIFFADTHGSLQSDIIVIHSCHPAWFLEDMSWVMQWYSWVMSASVDPNYCFNLIW